MLYLSPSRQCQSTGGRNERRKIIEKMNRVNKPVLSIVRRIIGALQMRVCTSVPRQRG